LQIEKMKAQELLSNAEFAPKACGAQIPLATDFAEN
jgi:hypothetical protein